MSKRIIILIGLLAVSILILIFACREWNNPLDPLNPIHLTDAEAPAPGGGGELSFSVVDGELTILWYSAEDEVTSGDNLSYQLYYSEHDNISTLADLKANGILLGDALNGKTDTVISGLSSGKTYWFNIKVTDIAGNEVVYSAVSRVINSYQVTYYGNGADGGSAPVDSAKYLEGEAVTVSGIGTLTLSGGYTWIGWNTLQDGSGTAYPGGSTLVMPAGNVFLYAQWSADAYTVTFDAQGGSVPDPESKVVIYDSTYGTLAATGRTGYSFDGWYNDAAGGSEVTSETIVTTEADHTLYAHWTANQYTVTFDSGGGDTPNPASIPVTYDSEYGTLATTSRTGYTFGGWFTDPVSGTVVTSTTMVTDIADHTLYAHWLGDSYTVTFDSQSGAIPDPVSKTVTYGSTYGTLATTSRTGYTFGGWYTDAIAGTSVTSDTAVSVASNHTLYAHWNAISYTVTFDAQDGTVPNPASKTVTFGSAYGTLATTSRTGYTFAGWYTDAAAGLPVDSTTVVSTSANHTLFARWTANNYTLTFDAQGGSAPSPASMTVTYDSEYGTLATTSWTGYTFAGWYTDAIDGAEVTSTTSVTTSSNHTLYAHWTGNQYTVNFDAQGGSAVPTSKTVTYGSIYDTLATAVWDGHTFNGWYTAGVGGTLVTSDTIVSESMNHTLYAQWSLADYTVTFDPQGGSAPSPTSITVTYSTAYGTLAATSRDGYTFTGWYTDASGGTEVTSATTVTSTAAHTLYAHWTGNSYAVTFDSQSGSTPVPAGITVTFGSEYGTLAATSLDGYAFAGWTLDAAGTAQVTSATLVSTSSDHTLYAQWSDTVYVSASGSPANNGLTPAAPLDDVSSGIALADSLGLSRVNVAAGDYTTDTGITMIDGVSLYGGYSADFSLRDPAVYTSSVTDARTSGITYAVYFFNITSSTVIDGMSITGSSSADGSSYGIYCDTSSPIINNNFINGGSGTAATAIRVINTSSPDITNNEIYSGEPSSSGTNGIYADANTVNNIVGNTIQTGDTSADANGIYLTGGALGPITDNVIIIGNAGGTGRGILLYDQNTNPLRVEGNYIFGGYAPTTIGIWLGHTYALIINNVIHGGEGTVNSYALNASNAFPDYLCNTIYGGGSGTSVNSYAIYNTNWAREFIDDNIIFAYTGGNTGYGIFEERTDGCEAESLWNNNFFDCITAIYRDFESLTNITDVADLSVASIGGAYSYEQVPGGMGNNVSIDPVFTDSEMRLGPSSPAGVTGGGIDRSSYTTRDRDGGGRTAPWSIGAYEYD